MTLHVRLIENSEYAEASRLVLRVFREMLAASMVAEGIAVFETFASSENIRARDLAGAVTYGAFENGRLLGLLQVRDGEHPTLFFTLPEQQRKGVGRALLQAADQRQTLKTVNSSVIAVGAYERFGFKVVGPEQVTDGIRFIPMARSLN